MVQEYINIQDPHFYVCHQISSFHSLYFNFYYLTFNMYMWTYL